MTTSYKIYSAKNQGCFSKDDLIYTMNEEKFKRMYEFVELEKIAYYAQYKVYIIKEAK